MNFPDVMLDIETTGIQPEHSSIIQIAAWRFNLKTQEVDDKYFDRCLRPTTTRFWDENTRNWWSKKRDVLEGLWARMEDPRVVLNDFVSWVTAGNEAPGYTLWAKPTHFEWPFFESYLREHQILGPFHYRSATDMNSFIRGRYWPETPPNIEGELEFIGDKHNAKFDTLHQIRVLFEATSNG